MINDENLIVLLLTLLARESAILNTAEMPRRYFIFFFLKNDLDFGERKKKEKKTEFIRFFTVLLKRTFSLIYTITFRRCATP